jgi:hypothetical protein
MVDGQWNLRMARGYRQIASSASVVGFEATFSIDTELTSIPTCIVLQRTRIGQWGSGW